MKESKINFNDRPLSQDEIDVLLAGVVMGNRGDFVVTAYGHGDTIDKISVSSFENSSGLKQGNDASIYCCMLNGMELKENSWVFARVVPESTPLELSYFLPERFSRLILALNDRSLQKVYREINNQEFVKALKGCSEAVMEKVIKNMTSRASQMLKEDMEYMGPVRIKDVEESREKIIALIRRLEDTGEIIITRSGMEDTLI